MAGPRRVFRFPWRTSRQIDDEVATEVEFHLDMRTQALVDEGMSEAEARRQARREFGDVGAATGTGRALERHEERRMRWRTRLEELVQDVRYGLRVAGRAPAFTAAAVVTLALGVAATTAIFTVVDGVLLRPLPYANADRLVAAFETTAPDLTGQSPTSPANFLDWRERSTTLEAMTAATLWAPTLTGLEFPDRLSGLQATVSLFDLIEQRPLLGRAIQEADGVAGRDRVAVVSYGLWQRHFGGDDAVIGRSVRLDGEPFTVVGVMPPGFAFPPFWAGDVEIWSPLVISESATIAKPSSRDARFLRVFARLRPGTSLGEAQAELAAIGDALEREYPRDNEDIDINLQPLHEPVVGDVRPALLVLMATVGLVLVIACANVANLLLARGMARRQELAVRGALGAGFGRLVRQLLTESLVLSALGGALGVALGYWGLRALLALAPPQLPRVDTVAMDGRVLAVAIGLTVLSAAGFGLAPAIRHARAGGGGAPDATRATAGRERHRMQQGLVVAQVGLALVLLIGAGLLINSFTRMQAVAPGFSTSGVVTMSMRLAPEVLRDAEGQDRLVRRVSERVEALPGVERAGFIHILHLGGDTWGLTMTVRSRPDEELTASVRTASPGALEALGIPLRRGRYFDDRDMPTGLPVAIVNETFAERYWPGETAVGRLVRSGTSADDMPWLTVVGVVGDVRQDSITAPVRPEVYFPYAQNPFDFFQGTVLVVRGETGQPGFVDDVRRAVWSIDRDLPLTQVRTTQQIVADVVARERFTTWLLGLFAATALVLALVGIHGVVSHAAGRRTREFGIRVALGATRGQVLGMMVRQGAWLAALGTALGLAGAVAGARGLESLLFGVTSTDPATFAVVGLVLFVVATLAAALAARSALAVDPAAALKHD